MSNNAFTEKLAESRKKKTAWEIFCEYLDENPEKKILNSRKFYEGDKND